MSDDSGCGCIYTDPEDRYDVARYKFIRGRKRHLCNECQCWLDKGEQHEMFSGAIDGHWVTYRTCMDCISARDAFFCNGWYWTMIWEDIRDHLEWTDIDLCCLEKLTPVARAKVVDIIDEGLEDDT